MLLLYSLCHCSYLWYSHVVSSLLVRVNDRTGHGPQGSQPLHVFISEDGFTFLPPLSQSHVQRFGCYNPPVHFSYCLCRLLGRREADEAKALALGAICHDLQQTKKLKFRNIWDVELRLGLVRCETRLTSDLNAWTCDLTWGQTADTWLGDPYILKNDCSVKQTVARKWFDNFISYFQNCLVQVDQSCCLLPVKKDVVQAHTRNTVIVARVNISHYNTLALVMVP